MTMPVSRFLADCGSSESGVNAAPRFAQVPGQVGAVDGALAALRAKSQASRPSSHQRRTVSAVTPSSSAT
ncbi:MAG: hypothetical protein R2699_10525 [Acidimicrobiales bacterium]